MSFRNTFVTDFIYSAAEGYVEAAQELNKAFENGNDSLTSKLDERGYGYFAGINRTHGGSVQELMDYTKDFIREIEQITKVPFRLTYMLESNAVITFSIEPRGSGDTSPPTTEEENI